MKGIILAGGNGTRLSPLTHVISKQLLPVFDKPMIYYPISILMNLGIREICVITTVQDKPRFEEVLGDGSDFGISFTFLTQPKPEGIAQSFVIAEEFINHQQVVLILGDNIYYGTGLNQVLLRAKEQFDGAAIFGYRVNDPSRYGVIEFADDGSAKAIIEKPRNPPSDYAVTGLYFYDERAAFFAKQLSPSARGEYEISDLNQLYLEDGSLSVHLFEDGLAWLDMGTHEALHDASSFVQTIQKRQGIQIACLEEIAFKKRWISIDLLEKAAEKNGKSSYGEHLRKMLNYEVIKG